MELQSIVPHISAATEALYVGKLDGHARTKIDADVTSIEEALVQLKAARNTSVSLMRLPPEVLTVIAEHLAVIWPSRCSLSRSDALYRPKELNWIQLSYVCTRLRSLLLSYPCIWAHNICNTPLWPQTTHARCRGLPLVLSLHSHSPPFMIAFALEHVREAREINFCEVTYDSGDESVTLSKRLDAQQFARSVFPHLEELKVEMSFGTTAHRVTGDVLALPPMIAPRLKSLQLVDFMIPFQPDALTTLRIQSGLDRHHFRVPLERLLALLRCCALLEHLHVQDCLPILPRDHVYTPEPITFSHLEDVEVDDHVDSGLILWSTIRTPQLQEMRIFLRDVDSRYPNTSSHLAPIAPRLRDVGSDVTGISLYDWADFGESDSVTLALHSADPGNTGNDWVGPFARDHRLKLHLCLYLFNTSPPHFIDALDMVSVNVDCSPVTTLELGCKHDFTSPVWSASLARFSNIHTLFLHEMPRSHAFLALGCAKTPPEEHPPVVLPALRSLWISKLDLRGFDPDEEELVDSGLDEKRFERVLKSRAQCGSNLEHLRIDTLLVVDAWFARDAFLPSLRDFIPTVECTSVEETD